MARRNRPADPKDREILEAHRRFLTVMEEQRLATLSDETKTHYLTMLVSLTEKLETPGKPLSEIMREMMAELAPLIFQTMQS